MQHKKRCKAQSAMEFLMTYGWAILVVLVVIATLIYFGVLDTEMFLSDKVELSGGLHVKDAAADEDSVVFIFENQLGRTLYDFQANVTECDEGKGRLSDSFTVAAGETKKIAVFCGDTASIGSKFKSGIDVKYATREGNEYLTHSSTGLMAVTVNKGSQSFASRYTKETISSCTTLNESYIQYVLSKDLIIDDNCMVVESDNIIIDLNGNSIINTKLSGVGSIYGILVDGYDGVTIENGCVHNFGTGIKLANSNGNTIRDMHVNQNWVAGIKLENSSGNSIENNVVCNQVASYDLDCDALSESNSGSGNKFEDTKACTNSWPTVSDYEICNSTDYEFLCTQESDNDGDGAPDKLDNCVLIANPGQEDNDSDSIGDACDNCNITPNADQQDSDGNGIGNACEIGVDSDGDEINNSLDNCPYVSNVDQTDTDDDKVGDSCDNCDYDKNADQANNDVDSLGDVCDSDDDNDGVADVDEDPDGDGDYTNDDTDNDGTPNYFDDDDDNDGTSTIDEGTGDNDNDGLPDHLDPDDEDGTGDVDGDGVPAVNPNYPTDSSGDEDTNDDGNPFNDDTDGDGIPNYQDPDDDGDSLPTYDPDNPDNDEDVNDNADPTDDDTDGDGTPDYLDDDDDGDSVDTADEDINGNGDLTDDDTDGDTIPNYLDDDDDGDGVPTAEEDANQNGDLTDDDADGDGTPDYLDSDTAIVAECQNGICEPGEDCMTCRADCGLCPVLATCGYLKKENQTYVISANIDNNTLEGPCIVVAAKNVTLNCNNKQITSTSDEIGIYSGNDSTILKNCDISMGTTSGTGIVLNNSADSVVMTSILNSQYRGIELLNSVRVVIDTVSANSNSDAGIYLRSSTNNSLIQVDAKNNNRGVVLDTDSNDNILRLVNASANDYGISISSGVDNTMIDDSSACSNSQKDLFCLGTGTSGIGNTFGEPLQNKVEDCINSWPVISSDYETCSDIAFIININGPLDGSTQVDSPYFTTDYTIQNLIAPIDSCWYSLNDGENITLSDPVYGDELAPTFDEPTDWSIGDGWYVEYGYGYYEDGTSGILEPAIPLNIEVGKTYFILIEISDVDDQALNFSFAGHEYNVFRVEGNEWYDDPDHYVGGWGYGYNLTALTTENLKLKPVGVDNGPSNYIDLDLVSVRELTHECNQRNLTGIYGDNTLTIYANDTSGNLGQNSSTFTLDQSTTLDSCKTLFKPNAYYSLSASIVDNSLTAPCIKIFAPGITLDCNSKSISSDDKVSGIYTDQEDTTVKECDITTSSGGAVYPSKTKGIAIEAQHANGLMIKDNTIHDTYWGIYISDSNDTEISDNIFSNDGISIRSYGYTGDGWMYGWFSFNENMKILRNKITAGGGVSLSATNNAFVEDHEGGSFYLGASHNTLIIDSEFSSIRSGECPPFSIPSPQSRNLNCINCTYSSEYTGCDGSSSYRWWYYQAHLVDGAAQDISGGTVVAYDKDGNLINSSATDASGITDKIILIDFKAPGPEYTDRTYYSPYIIYAYGPGKSTTYSYNVTAKENSLNEEITLAADSASPVVSSLDLYDIEAEYATFSWSTDEPSTSTIEYGETASLGQSVSSSDWNIRHTFTLADLNWAQTYHYKITSCDPAGNCQSSAISTFDTLSGDITTCRRLSRPGIQYNMTADISNNSITGHCIKITAPDVTLDCQNHKIMSDDGYAGIYSDQNRTIIKNCYVDMGVYSGPPPYGTGISLVNTKDAYLFNNTLVNSHNGLYLYKSTDATVEDSEMHGSYSGTRIYYSSDNVFTNNIATTNQYGVSFSSGTFNTLSNMTFRDNKDGMDIRFNSHNNSFSDIIVDSNDWQGIKLQDSESNTFTNIVSTSNNYEGVYINTGAYYNTFTNLESCGNSREDIECRGAYALEFNSITCDTILNCGFTCDSTC